jgi:hypothetical protein
MSVKQGWLYFAAVRLYMIEVMLWLAFGTVLREMHGWNNSDFHAHSAGAIVLSAVPAVLWVCVRIVALFVRRRAQVMIRALGTPPGSAMSSSKGRFPIPLPVRHGRTHAPAWCVLGAHGHSNTELTAARLAGLRACCALLPVRQRYP